MPYKTTPRADEDIIRIYVHGAREFGTAQAERYFAGLASCFDLLAEHPLLAREHPEFDPPVRIHIHKAHIIAYLVTEDGILIVRVLDGRQDWIKHLQPWLEL